MPLRSPLARFGTKVPTICAVCHRHAWWIGYAPTPRSALIWCCNVCCRHRESWKVYKMNAAELDACEKMATGLAGEEAGAYLDELGKTDLATLTQEEWQTFLSRIVTGFEKYMQKIIYGGNEPTEFTV